MRTVEFTLKTFLEAHGLSAYRLAQASQGRVNRGTVYALARGGVSRVDLGTLGAVITTLEELTGQVVTPGDLLVAVTVEAPLPSVPQTSADGAADPETRRWLDSDASHLGAFEPYDWGDTNPATVGEPVRMAPDGRLIIGEA